MVSQLDNRLAECEKLLQHIKKNCIQYAVSGTIARIDRGIFVTVGHDLYRILFNRRLSTVCGLVGLPLNNAPSIAVYGPNSICGNVSTTVMSL